MEAPISGSLGAMSSLLGKLDCHLKSQHLFRKPVRKEIELLKEDLEMIHTFLLELSSEDDPNQTKKYWMKEVREVSYDIEDYIDRLLYSQAKIRSVGVVSRLKISKLPSTLNRRPKIANQIQELRARLEDAAERHKRYILDNYTPSSSHRYSPYSCSITTLHGEASRLLIGIDDSREKLIKLLNNGEKQLKVISILGLGGIGKTALVKQVLEDHADQFESRAFVRASRKPDTRSILQSILSQTRCHHAFDACSVQQLIASLNEHLQNRRYLIVVDDLWDTTVWDILLCAFSDSKHSSRIITTTAIENVALTCSGDQSDYVLKMESINIDDSRKLFFKRVFGSEDKCPQQLKDASYEIIRRCGGVPLAIINIAGLLSSQPDKLDLWDHVQNSLGSSLSICPTTEGVINVINLGYNGLPHYLKTCLQYVTMYPENCTIWKDDLVRRWVAEGFISPKEGNDIEAVAESYFEELAYRGMIQPKDISYNDKVLSCTVHSLVLDLLINKCTEDNFVTTIDYSQNNRELSSKVRRLFFFFSTAKYAAKPSGVMLSQVRSLAFYGLIKCMPSVREFEFLRVLFLHFSGDYSGHTPFNLTGIRRLFQLRYLKVICNFSLQLPTHMEGLYNLETLELDAKVAPLPADIVNLRHLMHIRVPPETKLPDEIGHMSSLRTLKCFDICSSSEDKIRSLDELTNLKELELACTAVPSDSLNRNIKVLCSIVGSFCNLKCLVLVPGYAVTCSYTTVIDSSSTSSPPVCLERFEMHPTVCIFSGFPEWIRTLRRLCVLKIAVTEVLQNDMDMLGGLPGLTILSLCVRTATVERIVINSGAFPALKYFKFRCMTLSFVFQEEAMPNLHRLKLCFKSHRGLTMLVGIVHLLNLREVTVRIGFATGENNRQGADSVSKDVESLFKVAIGEHRRIPNVNIQCVTWADEDNSVPARNSIKHSSHFDHGILERTKQDDTNKNSDSRINKFCDMTVNSSDIPSSGDQRQCATDVTGMVSATEGTNEMSQSNSDMSNHAGMLIEQISETPAQSLRQGSSSPGPSSSSSAASHIARLDKVLGKPPQVPRTANHAATATKKLQDGEEEPLSVRHGQLNALNLSFVPMSGMRVRGTAADGHMSPRSLMHMQQLLSADSSRASQRSTIAPRWRRLHGEGGWAGLLDPLDSDLRRELLRYGDFVQAAYQAFHSLPTASARHRGLMLPDRSYRPTRSLFATSGLSMPPWAKRPNTPEWLTQQSNWVGYVAVCESEREVARMGRRDIAIVLRGTATCLEWAENLRASLVPLDGGEGSSDGAAEDEPKVARGFLSLYRTAGEKVRSLSEDAMDEVRRLMDKYKGEELSVTVVGHSLGAALALLVADELATSIADVPPVAVLSFGGPKVGNAAFVERLGSSGKVNVLRILNAGDVVTKVPGVAPALLNKRNKNEQYLLTKVPVVAPAPAPLPKPNKKEQYQQIGAELRIDSKSSPSLRPDAGPASRNDLEAYLHLVDGFTRTEQPFRHDARRSVLRLLQLQRGNVKKEYLNIKKGTPAEGVPSEPPADLSRSTAYSHSSVGSPSFSDDLDRFTETTSDPSITPRTDEVPLEEPHGKQQQYQHAVSEEEILVDIVKDTPSPLPDAPWPAFWDDRAAYLELIDRLKGTSSDSTVTPRSDARSGSVMTDDSDANYY